MVKKKIRELDNPFENMVPPQDYDFLANVDKDQFAVALEALNLTSSQTKPLLPGVDIDFISGRKDGPESGLKIVPEIKQPINQPFGHPDDQPTNESTTQSTNESVNKSTNESLSQPISQEINHPFGQAFDHRINHPHKPRRRHYFKNTSITEIQLVVLQYMAAIPGRCSNYTLLEAGTGLTWDSVRQAVRSLKKKRFLATEEIPPGQNFQGFKFSIPSEIIEGIINQSSNPEINHLSIQPFSHLTNQSTIQPTNQPPHTKVVVSSAEEKLLPRRMTWQDFTELCPTLVKDGFTNEQFNSVIANWERGLSLGTIKGDWGDFARSFVMAEWGANHLEETGWISAVAVVFERMKTGPMFKPKGYVDPSIQAMKDRLKELEEEKQLQEQLDLELSRKWWRGLSGDEQRAHSKKITESNKGFMLSSGNMRDGMICEYWCANIK
jgi:hypothetical protein